jgi:opacity protein-like surface antigen
MSARKLGVVLAAVCAALLVVPVAASAASAPTSVPVKNFTNIPVTGTAGAGKQFTGHFNVSQFITKGHRTFAVGTLTGNIGGKSVKRSNVAIPISVGKGSVTPGTPGTTGSTGSQVASPAATCPILHLELGPLTLNLLGLNVHLNRVVLDITATSGPGNLLGNLLCSVANLLNGSAAGSQLTALLNILNQLLGTPGLLTL